MTEVRTRDWLQAAGYTLDPEPKWITDGRKPDFFATGPGKLWTEVKELGATDHSVMFDRAWNDLRTRCDRTKLTGELHTQIGGFDAQACKSLMHYVKKESRNVTSDAPIYTFSIPGDPVYGTDVRVEYETQAGERVIQVGPASISNHYPYYLSLEPKTWQAESTLIKSNGDQISTRLFRLIIAKENLEPILTARLFPSDQALSLSANYAEAQANTSAARIRREVADSNKQIRNGQRFEQAPGLIVIYQETMDALGDEMLLSALFGNLAYELVGNPPRLGRAAYTRDGALTAENNRGISAVRYVRARGEPTFVVNPHADFPLAWENVVHSALVHEGDQFVLKTKPHSAAPQ